MKEAFIQKRFSSRSLALIKIANQILAEYAAQGYDLSLRQLYYQYISRDLLPNTQQSYSNLGNVISDARMAGLIDWNMIKDRGRVKVENQHWRSPSHILNVAARTFMIDKWVEQPVYIEVMVEKQALEGVLVPACREVDVAFMANKGYSSSSAMYEASKRMLAALEDDKEVHVLYLGDHDPSGIDMSRDVDDRLKLFLGLEPGDEPDADSDDYENWEERYYRAEDYDGKFVVHRLALNMDQVRTYNPPENPAKITDSRAEGYIARFGRSSWELDALEPSVLAGLVTDMVINLRDEDAWENAIAREEEMKSALLKYAQDWEKSA